MKRWNLALLLGLLMVFGLAACSQGTGEDNNSSDTVASAAIAGSTDAQNDGSRVAETIVAQVSDDFEGALSPMGQLALGTLRLEESQAAVTEEQAAELLPLWQAMQSLSNSETTAQVELDAVVKQIQETMTVEQVAIIADMRLTEGSLTEMLESGELAFRGPGGRNATVEGEDGGARPSGGFGTGPGGLGRPGGGPGGGPGGLGGGLGAGLSEEDIATRRAEFAENGLGDTGERFLTGAVVRLMQTKTGDAPADPGAMFDTVMGVITAETGLSVEAIQAALAAEQDLVEIIESNGGDVETVRAALVEAFEALPNAEEFDAQERADLWLNRATGQE